MLQSNATMDVSLNFTLFFGGWFTLFLVDRIDLPYFKPSIRLTRTRRKNFKKGQSGDCTQSLWVKLIQWK